MSHNDAPVWTNSSAALLQQFLESGTGLVFLSQLHSRRPGLITNTNDLNAVALKASEVAGFEACVNTILSLARPLEAEQTAPDTYPHLEDDSKWPVELQLKPEPPAKKAE